MAGVDFLLEALSRSPTHPVTNQLVIGHGRRAGLEDLYQTASFQVPNSTLYRRFGQTRRVGQVLQAQGDPLLLRAIECGPQDDVNQKSCRDVIVTNKIGQKHVNDVLVNRDMLHNTIA